MATRRLRAETRAAARGPGVQLQAAQARRLDLIPPGCGRVTDLASAMWISKQGLGQIVTQLAEMAFVEIVPDPADKRAKLVCPTGGATTMVPRDRPRAVRNLPRRPAKPREWLSPSNGW